MQKGATLTELVIVILLLLIIAVTAISRIGVIAGYRQEAAYNKVKSDIRYVKGYAMVNNCRTRIFFDTGASSYTATTNQTGSWADMTNPDTRLSPFTVQLNSGIYQGVQITSASFDGAQTLEFDFLGTPYSFNGSVSNPLSSDGSIALTGPKTIVITPNTGRIS